MKKYLLMIEGKLIDKKDDFSVTRSVRLLRSVFVRILEKFFASVIDNCSWKLTCCEYNSSQAL